MLLLCGAAGCAGGGAGGDGGMACSNDLQCDDALDCTIDTCGVSGVCRHDEIDERCPSGQVCETARGCVAAASCGSDADCDDDIACTIDSCGVGGICNHSAVNERCTVPGETCVVGVGCMLPAGCASDAECDDSVPCTRDSCRADRSCAHVALDELCNAGAGERCNPTVGCFVPMSCTSAAECDDGNFCNGAELCMPEFGCAPAERPRVCDDSDDCTVDSCSAALNMCVFACDPTRGPTCLARCPPPPAGCAGRFRLTGTTSFGCGFCTSVDFSEATFETGDGELTVRPRAYMTSPPLPGGLVLSDSTPPICPEFEAEVVVSGGCDEVYAIRGMFVDDDNFTATLEWRFVDRDGFSCDICSCTNGTSTVTGTRIP